MKIKNCLGENLDTCFCFYLYCMFFLFTKWSLIVTFYLLSLNPNLGIYGGIVSNFVCQFKNGCLWLIIIYWQWNLPHKQVYGSDTESKVTLKVTRVGMFLLICHGHISCDTTVVHLMWHHVYIFMYCSNWQKRGELCYDQRCWILWVNENMSIVQFICGTSLLNRLNPNIGFT